MQSSLRLLNRFLTYVKLYMIYVKVYIIHSQGVQPPSRLSTAATQQISVSNDSRWIGGWRSVPNSAPATIDDVARIAEVSIATVSRAIHTPDKVAKSTRQRVNQAIAITGYTTNAMARSLRMGRSNMILDPGAGYWRPEFLHHR